MKSQISQTHGCAGKCPRFNGERCNTCLVPEREDAQRLAELDQAVELAKKALNTFSYEPPSLTVCIEQEPLPRFHSKYCSPRTQPEQEPTATEALMEFMRFPGNAQPYCSKCAAKDDDLRVLRNINAERNFILDSKIVDRNIVIVVLAIIVAGQFIYAWSQS